MAWQIKVLTDISVEPVTLQEVKEWLRIDADYTSEDNILSMMTTASREKLEGELGVYFGVKTVELQLQGQILKLPYGPTGDILYIERVDGDDPYAGTDYITRGLDFKTIFIAEDIDEGGIVWWYPSNMGYPYPESGFILYECEPVYNIYYQTGYETLPQLLKNALLMQIDYAYKNQGRADMKDICPTALQIAKRFSQNLTIQ